MLWKFGLLWKYVRLFFDWLLYDLVKCRKDCVCFSRLRVMLLRVMFFLSLGVWEIYVLSCCDRMRVLLFSYSVYFVRFVFVVMLLVFVSFLFRCS